MQWWSWSLLVLVLLVPVVSVSASASLSHDSIAWCQQPTTTFNAASSAYGPRLQRQRRLPVCPPVFASEPRLGDTTMTTPNDDDTDDHLVSVPRNSATAIQCHDDQVTLPGGSGQLMQLLTCFPPSTTTLDSSAAQKRPIPVLLFLHGSFHGAWCWREHFLPFFASLGYISVAISWRGTSGSPPNANVNNKKIPIADHIQDLQQVLTILPGFLQDKQRQLRVVVDDDCISSEMSPQILLQPPVLISHSFGGMVVMKYLEHYFSNDASLLMQEQNELLVRPWSGIVSLCSVPPSGNGPMTLRYLQASLLASWRITRGLALKQCGWDTRLCRTLFFDDTVDDATLRRYQEHLTADSKVTIDLMDLATQLPSKQTDPTTGQALFLQTADATQTRKPAPSFPCLVVGATRDYIVDAKGVEETAHYFFGTATTTMRTTRNDVAPPLPLTATTATVQWVNSTHDVMLGAHWKRTADAIHQWLGDNHLQPNKEV